MTEPTTPATSTSPTSPTTPRVDPDFFLPLVLGDGHSVPQPQWSRFPYYTDRSHRTQAVLLLQDRLNVDPTGIYDLYTAAKVCHVLNTNQPHNGDVVGAREWNLITLEWIRRELMGTKLRRKQ